MSKTYVEQMVEDPQVMRHFQQERAVYEATELLESLMHGCNVSRTELAGKLGKTRSWVTQLLDGENNKTLRTLADAFAVLGHEFKTFSRPIQVSNKPADTGYVSHQLASSGSLSHFGGYLKVYNHGSDTQTVIAPIKEVA